MMNLLVVRKKSTYERFLADHNEMTRRFIAETDEDVKEIQEAHDEHYRTLDRVVRELERSGARYECVVREQLKPVTDKELVITVGGDGTVLDASHYVNNTPILGINSDPKRSTGFFAAATAETFASYLAGLHTMPKTVLNRMEIALDEKPIPELVLNDVLIADANQADMLRYRLKTEGYEHKYRSDGLLVCTAAGSTGWEFNYNGAVLPISSTQLQYYARGIRGEPFRVANEVRLHILSLHGTLFIDGSHIAYDFGIGSNIRLKQGTPLTLIGSLEKKRAAYIRRAKETAESAAKS